jgi:hypothetical protein
MNEIEELGQMKLKIKQKIAGNFYFVLGKKESAASPEVFNLII